ncbi:hypothetical protein [Paractinoplanes toevensis]|uniref:CdiI immunity protein domain-containing protein n=1 Tax=Paractinoplanes toevensis TaxID=571911 RepID=A0A920BQ50_9ACTN|nr:hypothetical protein [Actinoplanes toevensis]GIM96883.1 hypothetical protein Ato02nite_086760 [Actinoplanes toevensis]
MDLSSLPEWARRNIEERLERPPLETVRSFLGAYFNDADSFEEVRAHLRRLAQSNIRSHQEDLYALDAVIADPPTGSNVLNHLVAWDANWVLDDPSDASSLEFLREVAQMLREVIAEAPPSAERWRSWPIAR